MEYPSVDTPEAEQAAARQLRNDKFQDQNHGNLDDQARKLEQVNRAADKRLRGTSNELTRNNINQERNKKIDALTSGLSAEDQLALAAALAWRRIWQYSQEAAEDLAFGFMDFLIISGPVAMLLFLIRLCVGNWMNGGAEISFRGHQVPLVPKMGIIEGMYRGGKFILISVMTIMIYATGGILAFLILNPTEIPKFLGVSQTASIISSLIQSIGLDNIVSTVVTTVTQ